LTDDEVLLIDGPPRLGRGAHLRYRPGNAPMNVETSM
jgi:hypothetical protein